MKIVFIILLITLVGCAPYQYESFVSKRMPAKPKNVNIPIVYAPPKGRPYLVIGCFSIESLMSADSKNLEECELLQECAHNKGADAIFVISKVDFPFKAINYEHDNSLDSHNNGPRDKNDPVPTKKESQIENESQFFGKMSTLRETPIIFHEQECRKQFIRAQFIVFL